MTTPALLADYLFVGPLIRARLAAELPAFSAEGAVQDIEGYEQAVQRAIAAPMAFVAWDGDTLGDGDANAGRNVLLRQGWSVLIVARNATQSSGAWRDETVGPLLACVHQALAGWTPEGAFKPLKRVQGRPARYADNAGMYPMAFQIQLSL